MNRRAHVASLVVLLTIATAPIGVAAAGSPGRQGATMQSVKQLSEGARALVAATIPVETHQSYAIPVVRNGTLRLDFLFCPSIVKPNVGLLLQPPAHRLEIDAESGRLVELRAVAPRDFGQAQEASDVIGRYDMLPEGRTPEQFLALQARLHALYDALVPAYAAGTKPGDATRAKQAREFLALFPKVTEQPLQPYYRIAAADFFAWLGQQDVR